MLQGIAHHITSAPAWLVYVLAGVIVFIEDALFVGFVVPGETAALLAGVAASLGHASLTIVLITVIVAAIAGDSVGYEVGRVFGARILAAEFLRKREHGITAAQDFLSRRGAAAVLLARWTAFFRAVMPALAGTAKMPYPRFLTFNALGGLSWGGVIVVAGYLAGSSYQRVATWLGRGSSVIVAFIVIAAFVAWRIHKHRVERATKAPSATSAS